MAVRYVFNNEVGNQLVSQLDQMFSDLWNGAPISCSCSGTNSIVLTSNTNYGVPTTYVTGQNYSFIAANNSTGSVTVNANGLGALPLYLPSGSQAGNGDIVINTTYLIQYNSSLGGFQIPSVGNSRTPSNVQVFTATGTWTRPTSGNSVWVYMCGAGGGGGGGGAAATSTAVSGGGGGGGGAVVSIVLRIADAGASQTVTIGAAGTAGSGAANPGTGGNGGVGGTTTFGSLLSAFGGGGGAGGNTGASSGAGGGAGGGPTAAGGSGSGSTGGSGQFGTAPATGASIIQVIGCGASVYTGSTTGLDAALSSPFGGAGGGAAYFNPNGATFESGNGGAGSTLGAPGGGAGAMWGSGNIAYPGATGGNSPGVPIGPAGGAANTVGGSTAAPFNYVIGAGGGGGGAGATTPGAGGAGTGGGGGGGGGAGSGVNGAAGGTGGAGFAIIITF